MSTLTTAQAALERAQAARQRSKLTKTPESAAQRLDCSRRKETRQAIFRVLDALPSDSTFAFVAGVKNDPFAIWEYGPCPASAFRLLQDITVSFQMGEAEDRNDGFDVPANNEPTQASTTVTDDLDIDRLVNDLKSLGNCHVALAWQPVGTAKYHVRFVNYSTVEAFRQFADCMSDTVDSVLDLS